MLGVGDPHRGTGDGKMVDDGDHMDLKASAAGKVGGTGRYEMIHEKAPFWTWRWTWVRSCFILERNLAIFREAQTGRIMVIDIGYQEAGENMPDMVQN